jgi:hypothetical protein
VTKLNETGEDVEMRHTISILIALRSLSLVFLAAATTLLGIIAAAAGRVLGRTGGDHHGRTDVRHRFHDDRCAGSVRYIPWHAALETTVAVTRTPSDFSSVKPV